MSSDKPERLSRKSREGRMERSSAEEGAEEGAEPGASRRGNFINYYRFHPAVERLRQLPPALTEAAAGQSGAPYVALDVGCNSGELTLELCRYLRDKLPERRVSVLGIDLDPLLIERARRNNDQPDSVSFECLDFMSVERERLVSSYLSERLVERFSASFCFSVSMWIHLNEGDAGLERFLRELCSSSELLLLEPQPWRCYAKASRRLRRAGLPDFAEQIAKLRYRGDMHHHLDAILRDHCGFRPLFLGPCNDWRRRLLLYQRASHPPNLSTVCQ